MINDFILTVGLDKSFFVQLILAVALYFLSKKLFLKAYLENFKKTERLTKGKMSRNQDLEKKIEEQKALYEQKAKEVHAEFQKVFGEIKKTSEKKYREESENLQKRRKDSLKKQRLALKQALENQESRLQKESPLLADLLVEKIKG